MCVIQKVALIVLREDVEGSFKSLRDLRQSLLDQSACAVADHRGDFFNGLLRKIDTSECNVDRVRDVTTRIDQRSIQVKDHEIDIESHKGRVIYRTTVTKSSNSEYQRATSSAAWLSRPDRTVIAVRGEDRERFLQAMISNDVASLEPGDRMIAALLTAKGKLISDLVVHNAGETYWLEVDQNVRNQVRTTLDKFIISEDVVLSDEPEAFSIYTVLGPKARVFLDRLPPTGRFGPLQIEDLNCHASASALPVDPTVEVFGPWNSSQLVAKLHSFGDPISIETFETLRIEAGIPKFGVDIGEETLLLEVPYFDQAVSYNKGCYVGQETIARVHSRGGNIGKRLMGLVAIGSSAPIPLRSTVMSKGNEVGRVTSSCLSPKLGSPLALSMLHRPAFVPGTEVEIRTEVGNTPASVVSLPL
jgi:tRNA-modifying protein YgfZ